MEDAEDPTDHPAVHDAVRAFEHVVEDYETSRPDYPAAAVEAIVARLAPDAGQRILELGAGTGKLTWALLERGVDLVAVEPTDAMREHLRSQVPAEHAARFEVLDGRAEAIPLEDRSVAGVVAAQAFHWFDATAALRETHRVLHPEGWFAVVHNRRDLTSPPQIAIDDLLRPHRAGVPSWADVSWSDALLAPAGFEPPELLTFPHHQLLDASGFVARVASISFVASLPDAARTSLLEAAAVLFAMLEQQGEVELEYVTELRLLHRDAT